MEQSLEQMLCEFERGTHYGVFIDDTGSPGLATGSELHPERKSWVATIIAPEQMPEVLGQFPEALDVLKGITGAREFHFTEIWRGKTENANLEFEKRLALFKFFSSLFKHYCIPIIVQTLDPHNLTELHGRGLLQDKLGPFDFSRPEDTALLLLLFRVRQYLEPRVSLTQKLARVFVDAGWKREGTAIPCPMFEGVFANSSIFFAHSTTVMPLQLADFAAFCLNRMQLLRVREMVTGSDLQLLEILQDILPNFVNLPRVYVEFSPDEDEEK